MATKQTTQMSGIAVLVNVKPPDVRQLLQSLECFSRLVPEKCFEAACIRVTLRAPNLHEDRDEWLSARDFPICLEFLQGLTSAEMENCERVAGMGVSVSKETR